MSRRRNAAGDSPSAELTRRSKWKRLRYARRASSSPLVRPSTLSRMTSMNVLSRSLVMPRMMRRSRWTRLTAVAEVAAMEKRDRWAEWILDRRFGGDPAAAEATLRKLGVVRDRVLDRAGIGESDVVLDVGAGDGLIAFGALARGDRRCEFVQAPAEDLAPIADESVDVVTTRSVIIYVEDKRRAFAEFFRVLRRGGRLSMFEPINRFGYPEPDGTWMGIEVGPVWELARRVRDRYNEMAGDEGPMLDFDERDLLELAHGAGFERADVLLEARIERGALWDAEPPTFDRLLNSAPNPNAPTFAEVLDAELDEEERERFLAYVRPRYEAGETVGRSAVAYLRATKRNGSSTRP